MRTKFAVGVAIAVGAMVRAGIVLRRETGHVGGAHFSFNRRCVGKEWDSRFVLGVPGFRQQLVTGVVLTVSFAI